MTGGRRLAWALAAMALVGGCAIPGTDEANSPDPVAGTPTGTRAGTLRVGITHPGTIDPGNASTASARLIVSTMCDTLVSTDVRTGELRPSLARLWRVADGGKHVTIKLRDDARFSDGTPVDARAVVETLTRIAREDYASDVAPLLSSVAGYEAFHGDVETESELATRALAGVRVTDPRGLEFRLSRPNAELLRILAHPATAPISTTAERKQGREFPRQPVCSGPYRLAQPWTATERVIALEAVADYEGHNTALTNGGRGYAERIEFHIFDSDHDALGAYEAGRVDVAPVTAAERDEVHASGDLVEGNGDSVEMVGLPTVADSPFRDPAVHVAMSQAIDRRRLVSEVFGETRLPASGFLPPALGELHRDGACGARAPVEGDVAAARETLSRAAVELAGKTLPLYFNDEFAHARLAGELAAQWRDAFGLDVRPTPMSWEEFSAKVRGAEGVDGAFRASWSGLYDGADAYLAPLFASTGLGATNLARFNDRAFDRALDDRGRSAEDDVEQRLGYHAVEELACRSMPMIPLAFTKSRYAVRKGAWRSAADAYLSVGGTPLLRELWPAP